MSKLWRTDDYFDAVIKLDDGSSFYVHKIMLAKDSGFFCKLFTYENESEYRVGNVTSKAFRNILDWIYKVHCALYDQFFDSNILHNNFFFQLIIIHFHFQHELKLELEDDALELLREADYLCCLEIVDVTTKILKNLINDDNVLGTMIFCQFFNLIELERWCQKYALYNFERVSQGAEFLCLSSQDLEQLLRSDQLNVREIDACHALNRWVEHDPGTRVGQFTRLFEVLRHGELWDDLCQMNQDTMQVTMPNKINNPSEIT